MRDQLAALQALVDAGDLSIDEVGPAFERLAWSLIDVTNHDDAPLRGWVNDLERIRFTLRRENQLPAAADVLRQARPLFDRVA